MRTINVSPLVFGTMKTIHLVVRSAVQPRAHAETITRTVVVIQRRRATRTSSRRHAGGRVESVTVEATILVPLIVQIDGVHIILSLCSLISQVDK